MIVLVDVDVDFDLDGKRGRERPALTVSGTSLRIRMTSSDADDGFRSADELVKDLHVAVHDHVNANHTVDVDSTALRV